MLKLSDNPPVLAPVVTSLNELDGRWFIAHTKSRCEKVLAWCLHQAGVTYFLPMVDRISISGGKKRRAKIPLFPSHVFLNGTERVRAVALATGFACRVIDVTDQSSCIHELEALHKALSSGVRLEVYRQPAVGKRCRILTGALSGVTGMLVKDQTWAQVVLPVRTMGRGASVMIERKQIDILPAIPTTTSIMSMPLDQPVSGVFATI